LPAVTTRLVLGGKKKRFELTMLNCLGSAQAIKVGWYFGICLDAIKLAG
jgi:hypothetical protein